ncbi:unnamed protein product [Phyllotreta striolata]|uniref:Ion transport domain-containing protein n=1 Tax=Phyllotreta striolata TaxID=444603 RepID=A0A9P0GYP2_PHYSR|nr:unnamed protein product [Phyllotreta striolata]
MASPKLWGVRAALQFLHRTAKLKEESDERRNDETVLRALFATTAEPPDPDDPADRFIDCGPSPPADDVPFIFDYNYEHPYNETEIKICYHTIERNLLDHMDNVFGRVQLLDDIRAGRIAGPNAAEAFFGARRIETNIAFLWAALIERWDLLEALLRLGADLNYHEPAQGLGALHLAAFNNSIASMQFLVAKGCDVNLLQKFYTPLHCAAFGDSAEAALFLIKRGARIDQLTNSVYEVKESALHCAVRANAVNCVKMLVMQGADAHFPDYSAVHLAADLGNAECLRHLLDAKNARVDSKTKEHQYTPLHLAAMGGHAECQEMLIERGADCNEKDHRGQTPLHFAARTQNVDCLELLLGKGAANPNAEDFDRRTPLHAAIGKSSKSSQIIELLILNGANPNVGDQYGYAPLHVAALKGLSECVEALIYYGADVTAKTKCGMTALSIIRKKVPLAFSMFTKKLDNAVSLHHLDSSNELELRLDFKVILQNDHPGEVNFLYTLVEEGYKTVLLHPLCSALLYLKWEKIRKYYLARILFYCIFVMSLSLYVLTALAHHCYNYGKNFNEMKPEDVIELCEKKSILGRVLRDSPFVIEMQWFVLVGITSLEILRKLYGLGGYHSTFQYFSYAENIIEWSIVCSVFVISFIYTGRTYLWQNHIGAFAILLGWTNIMLMVGQLPIFGSYVAMYTRVQSEFAKLLLAYSGLLIGFTLSFCVIFPDSNFFANPFISLISIIVMLSGELNLDILVDDNPDDPHYLLEFSAQVTYVIFVLSVTIILMNLLAGIAVDDIKGLQKTATLSKLVRQTKLISHMEKGLFNGGLPRFFLKRLHVSALVSPKPSKVVLNVKPLNPKETRLPKQIIRDAFEVAQKQKHFQNSMHTPSEGLGYYWFSNDDHKAKYCCLNNESLDMMQEEMGKRNEEIAYLREAVQDMRRALLENQETMQEFMRVLMQNRRGSKC